jgi:LPS-assembly protein
MPVTIRAVRQEKDGPVYKLHGEVRIDYGGYTFSADDITYNAESGETQAEGNLLLEGGPNDEHIQAARGRYNLQSESGRFEGVTGSVGLRFRNSRSIITTSNPFFFTGKLVEKSGPDHYLVLDGTVTTCELPRPKWLFSARKVVVDVGGNANIYHSTFLVEGIPVLYLPFATHPVQKEPRQSGFLLPNLGHSSTRGYTFGESAYWAMSRSMDLTAGAEYFSRRGWAPDGEFRARPTENSFVDLNFFTVLDRGLNGANQGGTEAHLNSEVAFAHNFRAVADIDYLSSYVFRLAFSDVFAQAVNSEVRSVAFLSNTSGDLFLNATASRYQDFQSTTPGDVISILHAPGAEVSIVDRQLWNSPFYVNFTAAAQELSRSEPNFSTGPLLGRFDLNPVLSVPRLFRGWSLRPELSLRDTIYTKQLVPSSGVALTDVGTAIDKTLNRKSLQGSIEVRPPALERIFEGEVLGRKWKHVVEPRIVYSYVTGVENFPHILRFDERDILSDSNAVEYAIVNRWYAKRTALPAKDCASEGMPALMVGAAPPPNRIPWERGQHTAQPPCPDQPAAREIVTWELGQKYFLDPTFGGALVPGKSNLLTSTVDLTGIAFLTEPRHLSPLISRLRVSTGTRSDLEWDMDYDFQAGRINMSTALLNTHFSRFTFGAGNAFLQVPGGSSGSTTAPTPQTFNQFRAVLGYGSANKRGFSGAASVGFDARINLVQYASGQFAYNWDCCGINIEYRRFALASVRNENQYRFTFALANVGAFGNLRRADRLF